MSKNYIFCYSGSGNCLDIAKNIAEELGDTDIVMMRKMPAVRNVINAKTVGFVFPCYAGGLPGDVEKFAAAINVGWDAYTYAVVSYCGYPGVGIGKINKIVPLDYWAGISHHGSCIWLFPHSVMMPHLNVEKAEQRSRGLAKQVAEDVKNRVKTEGKMPGNLFNKIESRLWPALALKKAAAMSVNPAKCIGCGKCAEICPKENITISNAKPVFGMQCIGCLSCLQYCPQQAINVGRASEKRERYHNPNVTADELKKEIIHID